MDKLIELKIRLAEQNIQLNAWNRQMSEGIDFDAVLDHSDALSQMSELYRERLGQVGTVPLEETYALLDEMCDLYLEAPAEQRDKLRSALGENRAVRYKMYDYISRASQQLAATQDLHWLRSGLAAAALEDGRTDWRDLLISLGDLYLAADAIGVDPQPYFRTIAQLANPHEHGHWSTQRVLMQFPDQAYFAASVKPKLRH